jgi:hypothetical protein
MLHKYRVGEHLLFTSQYKDWSQYNGSVTITELVASSSDVPCYMISVYHPRFVIQITAFEKELTRF